MRRLLLKFAHFILHKYGTIPLDMKDKVLYDGKIFEIQSMVVSKEYFKTDLEIKMRDCFKWDSKTKVNL